MSVNTIFPAAMLVENSAFIIVTLTITATVIIIVITITLMPAINSKIIQKFVVVDYVLQNVRNFHVVLKRLVTKCTKIYNAHPQQLFCSLNLL